MTQLADSGPIALRNGMNGFAILPPRVHQPAMIPPSPLDDPANAAFAWGRYKRLMRLMLVVTAVVEIAVLGLLYVQNGFVSIHLYIATALGIGITMLLGSALMGLVFLSSGTGHDEAIIDPTADESP